MWAALRDPLAVLIKTTDGAGAQLTRVLALTLFLSFSLDLFIIFFFFFCLITTPGGCRRRDGLSFGSPTRCRRRKLPLV